MSAKRHLIGLAAAAALGLLASATAAFAGMYDYESTASPPKPMPCSLAGVNPGYHPDIFGNPATARAWGYVQARDGSWHVSCGNGAQASAGAQEGAPHHHSHSHKVTKPQ